MFERSISLRLMEYGMNRTTFTDKDLIADQIIHPDSLNHILQHLTTTQNGQADVNDVLKRINYADGTHTFTLHTSALIAYIDYLEIKEARRSSKLAFWLSIAAIILSTVVGGAQIYLQLKSMK